MTAPLQLWTHSSCGWLYKITQHQASQCSSRELQFSASLLHFCSHFHSKILKLYTDSGMIVFLFPRMWYLSNLTHSLVKMYLFLFTCLNVLPECMYVKYAWGWCPQKQEELELQSVIVLMWMLGTKIKIPGPAQEQQVLFLNLWAN